jgi:3-hydroxyisobutyrate dehydrogenase-like beta-hydroxyacid dehydrogenase
MTGPVTVGLFHPGHMGAAIGGQLSSAGHRVLWYPIGRSDATRARAQTAALEAVSDLTLLLEQAEIVICVCPPAFAEDVAQAAAGFSGVWVEGNPIAPRRVTRIAASLSEAVVVDGGIVGSPPGGEKRCMLYLSGPAGAAQVIADLFTGTKVDTRYLGDSLGQASALKLAYSTYQKVSRVLAALSYGLAVEYGVEKELLSIAAKRSGSYLAEVDYIPKVTARAWRWGPELLEAADVLADAGLPDYVLRAAAALLARWGPPDERASTAEEALRRLRDSGT